MSTNNAADTQTSQITPGFCPSQPVAVGGYWLTLPSITTVSERPSN